MDARSLPFLIRLLSLGTTSLLQYVTEASPWSADRKLDLFHALEDLADEERDAIATLMRYLQRNHVRVPPLGSYPSHFTTMNFVTVAYMIPRLIAEITKEIAQLERDIRAVEDADALEIAQSYLNMKRRHLESLRALAQTPAA